MWLFIVHVINELKLIHTDLKAEENKMVKSNVDLVLFWIWFKCSNSILKR